MYTNNLTLCFLLTLLPPLASAFNSTHSKHSGKHIPALYVFGDSLVDSGNNNYIPTKSRANFPPFGIDFGGKPTGRCTNGKTVVDYIAILLGLPFVPPYLGLTEHQRNKLNKGINYASAGSGILPETNNKSSLPFDNQTKLFQRTVENNLPNMFKTQSKLERHLSESLFVISSGLNDYSQLNNNRTLHTPRTFAMYLLKEFSKRLQRLYNLGARKFLVNNIAPAGCFPSTAIHMRPRGKCNNTINKMYTFYNRRLPGALHRLQSQLPGSIFVHSDLNKFLLELRASGNKYGILNTWKPCCPKSIDGDLQCHPYSVPCKDRNTYLYFGDHPSQITNHIYARRCFNESTICRPLNLKQLLHD